MDDHYWEWKSNCIIKFNIENPVKEPCGGNNEGTHVRRNRGDFRDRKVPPFEKEWVRYPIPNGDRSKKIQFECQDLLTVFSCVTIRKGNLYEEN